MYETRSSVLVIVFNRPALTREVIRALRLVKPKRLYVSADGPRENRKGEAEKCQETLAIFDQVDWPCEILYRINKNNLGSHTAIPRAVDWFFENEEYGIVLEDDCVPNSSFFKFCDDLLEKYKEDNRVMWINGSNLGFKESVKQEDYYYSVYAISWGWASWRRAWKCFNEENRKNVSKKTIRRVVNDRFEETTMRIFWRYTIEYAYKINNWDYRWLFTLWSENGVACTPKVNLVKNKGFGIEAMHPGKASDPRAQIKVEEILEDIVIKKNGSLSKELDKYLNKTLYRINVTRILKVYIAARVPYLRRIVRHIRGLPV